jgi:hypothetical protein
VPQVAFNSLDGQLLRQFPAPQIQEGHPRRQMNVQRKQQNKSKDQINQRWVLNAQQVGKLIEDTRGDSESDQPEADCHEDAAEWHK